MVISMTLWPTIVHDDAWVDAEREQQRDARVAQAVERDPADAMLVAQLTEPAGEIAGFKWCAPGGAEDVAVRGQGRSGLSPWIS